LCILAARDIDDNCYGLSCPLRRTVQTSVLGFLGKEERAVHHQQQSTARSNRYQVVAMTDDEKELILPPRGQSDTCSQCGLADTMSRTARFTDLPACLVVHLKRFRADVASQTTVKICDAIEIEPVLLIGCRERTASYLIRAVVFHHGVTLHRGHYTCLVYSEQVSQWFHVNDTQCDKVTVSWPELPREYKQDAYMLFYIRAATR
jgi:uncharacterized UBP type Zn finger protein